MNEPEDKAQLEAIRDLLTDLVKAVVTRPNKVQVIYSVIGPMVAYQIKTEQEDVRRVIGSKGKHFKALENILASICRQLDRESHLALDDKGPSGGIQLPKQFVMPPQGVRDFNAVKALVKKVVVPFLSHPEKLDIQTADIGTSTLFHIKIPADDYATLYGIEMQFEYGPDGHLIGSIKNLFDGIGKNHGRIVKITMSKA